MILKIVTKTHTNPHSLTVFETSHTRPIDFKSLKVDWNKIIG
jgi:hypothetical protein